MRPSHAERKRARRAGKTLLRALAPAAAAAVLAMDPGAEAIVFLPDGRLAHLLRENEVRFHISELEDLEAAASVALRWRDEDRTAGAVQ